MSAQRFKGLLMSTAPSPYLKGPAEAIHRLDNEYVLASDYDALAAELAKLKEARELSAKASATLRDESLSHQARAQALEAMLRELIEMPSEDSIELWAKAESLLADAKDGPHNVVATPSETPASTLCAICDQIKELHPATHPWTAKGEVAK